MEGAAERDPVVDPEVRAFVFSLVNALGGSSASDEGRYVLGDDALAVLKDIKRWLRLYDDKTNRYDVARLLAEANLVKGDLLEILAGWREDAAESSFRAKIALVCVDLLTQLTWPIEKGDMEITMHHFLHIPYLRAAQANYKSAVLGYDTADILRTVVRVGLPAMAQPRNERSPTEDNIIKVVLYFFRNIAMITQPEAISVKEADNDISRSRTVDAFHEQDIFDLMLTVGSSLLDDFPTHDVEILDILFHLLKGVDAESLFMERKQVEHSKEKELKALIAKEKGLLASSARHAPSRHNRFGTMLWIKREGERYSTVFGQGSVVNEQLSMAEMDKGKKWKKPRRPNKNAPEGPQHEFDTVVPLSDSARNRLRDFVDKFLDSSFNPVFTSVRRAIEREQERVLEAHSRQYFYLIAWFLRADGARRRQRAKQLTEGTESESFALVASVLNQETFVLLNRKMQTAQDNKDWRNLNAAMKCFTQILLTVQDMSASPLDEDQEISENILNRIFYEQTTHDRITSLLRSYKDQGFGYLDACTELAHGFLRLLERYSKQNVDMQVRSRRRARKKIKEKQPQTEGGTGGDEDRELEAEDISEAQRTTSERKFDFSRFAARFVNQASVDTFAALLKYYADLNEEQLKRAHRFLYRVAFKMDLSVLLFRLDIIALLHKMVKGPEGLDLENPMFKEWEELSKQVFRRLLKYMQERPVLGVELLFSKIHSTIHYLEHGYDKEIIKRPPRAPAELEIKPGMDKEQEIGVAVSIMLDKGKPDALVWIKEVLTAAATERKSWEDAEEALRVQHAPETIIESIEDPTNEATTHADGEANVTESKAPSILVKKDTDERGVAMERDKHLRLLMTVLGIQRLFTVEDEVDAQTATWFIPSSLSSSTISEYLALIRRFEFEPPMYDEGKSAESFVRSKAAAARSRAQQASENEHDSEGESELDGEGLFPAGGPTVRQSSQSPNPNKPKRHRTKHAADELLDESVLEARREARRKAELAKRKKIKSSLYVHDSDDESDPERDKEFFAREEKRRIEYGKGVAAAAQKAQEEQAKLTKEKSRSRKRAVDMSEDESDSGSSGFDTDASRSSTPKKRRKISALQDGDPSEADDSVESDSAAERRLANASRGTDEDGSGQSQPLSGRITPDSDAETEADTTPPSSQRPSSGHESRQKTSFSSSARQRLQTDNDEQMHDSSEEGGDSDKENAQVELPSKSDIQQRRRNVRAGFVIESDSDE